MPKPTVNPNQISFSTLHSADILPTDGSYAIAALNTFELECENERSQVEITKAIANLSLLGDVNDILYIPSQERRRNELKQEARDLLMKAKEDFANATGIGVTVEEAPNSEGELQKFIVTKDPAQQAELNVRYGAFRKLYAGSEKPQQERRKAALGNKNPTIPEYSKGTTVMIPTEPIKDFSGTLFEKEEITPAAKVRRAGKPRKPRLPKIEGHTIDISKYEDPDSLTEAAQLVLDAFTLYGVSNSAHSFDPEKHKHVPKSKGSGIKPIDELTFRDYALYLVNRRRYDHEKLGLSPEVGEALNEHRNFADLQSLSERHILDALGHTGAISSGIIPASVIRETDKDTARAFFAAYSTPENNDKEKVKRALERVIELHLQASIEPVADGKKTV